MKDLTLTSPTTLIWHRKTYNCVSGQGGIQQDKKEGDGATPVGNFPLRRVFYRADRVKPFPCALPLTAISSDDGWVDDPLDPLYNQFVKLPYPGCLDEKLWREDSVYDIIVVVGYNDDPVIPHKGSAIFIHIIRPEKTPTAGCIALAKEDLISILSEVTSSTQLCVL